MLKILGISTGIALLFILALSNTPPAHAAALSTIQVNSNLDQVDKKPGDGICASKPSNKCTLRAAIQEANALGGKHTIKLPAGTYVLSHTGAGEEKSKKGDLDTSTQITIKGAGAASTIIDGDASDRIFDVHLSTLSLSKITVRHGLTDSEDGAGIYVHSTATLKTKLTRVIGNTTQPTSGGGYGGGGIYAQGSIILTQTLVSGNTAYSGGGVAVDQYGDADIISSLLYNNTSLGKGALYSNGITYVTNSTISGNSSATGGGIAAGAGLVYISNATMADNNGGTEGGGIYNYGAEVDIQNTILEVNHGTPQDSSCTGNITSFDYNIVNPKNVGCTISGTQTHNHYDGTPSLFTLRDDGGFTMTHPLLQESPAVDGGNPLGCMDNNGKTLTTDQRGMPRPVDGDGTGGAVCDIGASELQP